MLVISSPSSELSFVTRHTAPRTRLQAAGSARLRPPGGGGGRSGHGRPLGEVWAWEAARLGACLPWRVRGRPRRGGEVSPAAPGRAGPAPQPGARAQPGPGEQRPVLRLLLLLLSSKRGGGDSLSLSLFLSLLGDGYCASDQRQQQNNLVSTHCHGS